MKTKKKRSFQKMEHFFSPNSSGHPHSDAHRSQIIGGGGDAYVDHTQFIRGDTVKLLGDISPRVSAPLVMYLLLLHTN